MWALSQSLLNELAETKGNDGSLDLLSPRNCPNIFCTKLKGGKVREVKSIAQGYS